MDVLSDILRLMRLKASVYLHSQMCGYWAADSSGEYKATFHLIARGHCWLRLDDVPEPIALNGGDLIVFPHDARHIISSSATPPDERPNPMIDDDRPSDAPPVSLICGYFDFDDAQSKLIIEAMPEVIHIKSEDTVNASWLDSLLHFIVAETESEAPGADAVVDKLSDVLFIQVVRTYMRDTQLESGLLAAIADKHINRALNAMHAEPGHAWSIESLAAKAGQSRSAFSNRFHQLAGQTPMQYLIGWRMQCAHEDLAGGNESVASIAEKYNYNSEASFAKAFKKAIGVGPGEARRLGRGANS
jgi:AraC-like DNA-binding protein